VVAPAAPAAPADGGKDGSKKTGMTAAPATIIVSLPADARLSIDDAVTTSTSDRRVFVSPELNPGREYHYTLKAEWTYNGKPVTATREVAVSAGKETTVSFTAEAATGVASR
jgi:uncharacterized protein (TIGR03000 family)